MVLNQYRNTTEGQNFITKRNQIAKESKKRHKTEVFTEPMTTRANTEKIDARLQFHKDNNRVIELDGTGAEVHFKG